MSLAGSDAVKSMAKSNCYL